MTRNLKTLGLALSAVAASAASAGKLTLSGYPGVLEGVQTEEEANEFTLEGGRSVRCEEVKYSGEYKESEVAEEMMSVTPEYIGCTAEILGNATPMTTTVNGCKITLSLINVTDTTNADGAAHLVCPTGKKLETHIWKTDAERTANGAAFCTYTIPEQTLGGKINYSFDGTHESLTIKGGPLTLTVERSGGTLTNCGKATQAGSVSTSKTVTFSVAGSPATGTFS